MVGCTCYVAVPLAPLAHSCRIKHAAQLSTAALQGVGGSGRYEKNKINEAGVGVGGDFAFGMQTILCSGTNRTTN